MEVDSNALLDQLLVHLIVGVHVPNHLLQLVGGEDVAEDIEYLTGAFGVEIILDGPYALEEFLEEFFAEWAGKKGVVSGRDRAKTSWFRCARCR